MTLLLTVVWEHNLENQVHKYRVHIQRTPPIKHSPQARARYLAHWHPLSFHIR